MRSKKKRRIVRIKGNPINFNIGLIIFILIFVYLGISCFLYLTREKIAIYEVVKGESEELPGISVTGIALRTEQITTASATGYINYYVKDGSRVAVNETVYTVDESGSFSELLKEAALNDNTLTNENVTEIKKDITSFISDYNRNNFENTYNFKYDLNSTLIECVNLNALDTINQSLIESGSSTLNLNKATVSGIIEFYTDGMENLTADKITKEYFNQSNYHRDTIDRDKPTESGSPIYKTVTDESWQIVIPLTDEEFEAYSAVDVVNIVFPSEKISTSAYFSLITNGSEHYGVIDLKRYMIQFAGKRYVDIKIQADTKSGLKVPKSAITEKEFFTIPTDYVTIGGDSKDSGIMVEQIDDNGESLANFTIVDIIASDDTTCYIESDKISSGTILIQPDTKARYKIDGTTKLQGVYNVNTGLASFRYVKILSEKNGYYIVESGTKYGLQVYDQIVLNAALVKENQIIFR